MLHVFLYSKTKKFLNFSPFFHVFKVFHQKVWFKYQLLGVLRTKLLVKNLITDIRTKFKVFQITFPLFYHIFPLSSYFLDSWIHFSLKIQKSFEHRQDSQMYSNWWNSPFPFVYNPEYFQVINMKHSHCVMYKNPLTF